MVVFIGIVRSVNVLLKVHLPNKRSKRKMTDKEIGVIIKPIFAKMVNSKFFAYEYGIECYKKGMEYQGIKELAIENDNLIKQVRILKEQIEKMKCCGNCDGILDGGRRAEKCRRCMDSKKLSEWELAE